MTGFLLDTQIILWMLLEPHRLSKEARRIIAEEPSLFVSASSLWEVETKRQIGKLRLKGSISLLLSSQGIRELSITWRHAQGIGMLPLIHRDPFDRILAAQALVENLALVTADRDLARYPIRTIF